MMSLVTLEQVRSAAERIRGVAAVTPLVEAAGDGLRVWLKCENLQRTGAFKIRGAYNMMSRLAGAGALEGAVTYSSGNHGLAVACAARMLGVPAVIVMPETAPAVKVEGARSLGAEVIFEGRTTIQRKARAEAEASARGLTIVPPFDHPDIIAGQGTIGLEILEQLPRVSAVFVPVSGGGLISGIAAAIKGSRAGIRVVGVEPSGAPKMTESLRAGHPVTLERTSSIADGLLAVRPGETTFPHVQALVDEIVRVDDDRIVEAMKWLFSAAKLVVEPSGAIAAAAALAEGPQAAGSGTAANVAVLSGGNVAAADYARWVAGPAF
ncbi:MAG: threonine/serine dehydratase [Vicinamibacterales bacterium]